MSPIITVSALKKDFKIYEKLPGLTGSIKSLFYRKYSTVRAVDDINFSINAAELVGFIGPNGAGKTTTLKTLSGLLYPTSGEVKVLGFTPWDRKVEFQKQFTLIMGQKNQLWWDLPAIETFILNKEIYEVSNEDFDHTLNELVDLLEVKDQLNVQVRKLSLGQRMKMELIASLIHRPKLLFLDEPTIGLDVVMQKRIRDFIKNYNLKNQATVILTSHYMEDVKELCKRVIIIDKGKILFDGSLAKITNTFADYKVITLFMESKISTTQLATYGTVISYDYPKATLSIKRDLVNSTAAKILKNLPISDINIEEPQIEEIIRSVFSNPSGA